MPRPDNCCVTSLDKTLRVFDVRSGQQVHSLKGHEAMQAEAAAPDGRHLAVGYRDGSLQLWDIVDGRIVMNLVGHTSAVRSLSFSPDGRHLLSGSSDKTARVFEVDAAHKTRLDEAEAGQIVLVAGAWARS